MRNPGLPVAVHQFRMLQVVEVNVRIDERKLVTHRL